MKREKTKQEALRILDELGISEEAALDIFYRQVVLSKGLPFSVSLNGFVPSTLPRIKNTEIHNEYFDVDAEQEKLLASEVDYNMILQEAEKISEANEPLSETKSEPEKIESVFDTEFSDEDSFGHKNFNKETFDKKEPLWNSLDDMPKEKKLPDYLSPSFANKSQEELIKIGELYDSLTS